MNRRQRRVQRRQLTLLVRGIALAILLPVALGYVLSVLNWGDSPTGRVMLVLLVAFAALVITASALLRQRMYGLRFGSPHESARRKAVEDAEWEEEDQPEDLDSEKRKREDL